MNTFERHKRSRDRSNVFKKIANIQKRSKFVCDRSKNEDVNLGNSILQSIFILNFKLYKLKLLHCSFYII